MPSTTSTKALDKPFSEVIASGSESVIAQCYKDLTLDKTLSNRVYAGSCVKIVSSYDNSYAAFGLVTKISSTSIDNIHRPSALGLNPEELEELQPQVYELLKKELEVYLFAYKENNKIFNYAPKKSLIVHDFVYFTTDSELLSLSDNLYNLFALVKRNNIKIEILYDLIYEGYRLRNYNYDFLVKQSKELMLAYSDDPDSIMPLLKRFSSETPALPDRK